MACVSSRQLQFGQGQGLDLLKIFSSQIDTRSFASLWYWIMIALMWAGVTRQVMGVPHDVIARARRFGGGAQADFESLARLNAQRLMYFWQRGGLAYVAITAFFFSGLFVMAFGFGMEFAQALVFLITPMAIIGALSMRAAHLVLAGHGADKALHSLMWHLRIYVQVLGFIFILLTAVFGFMHNFTAGFYG